MSTMTNESHVEQQDEGIAASRVTRIAVVGVVITLAGIACAGWILHATDGAIRGGFHVRSIRSARAPDEIGIVDQTQIEDARTGARLRRLQFRLLGQYGWVDRAHGIARIPIDRAMAIVAQSPPGGPAPTVVDVPAAKTSDETGATP